MKTTLVPLELLQNKGYAVWFGKYGLFGYNHSGEAFGKPYCKSYIWMIYKDKNGQVRVQYKDIKPNEMSRKRPGTMMEIRLQPEWIDGLIKLLIQLRENLIPSSAEDNEEDLTIEQEQSEIESLMARVGFKEPINTQTIKRKEL